MQTNPQSWIHGLIALRSSNLIWEYLEDPKIRDMTHKDWMMNTHRLAKDYNLQYWFNHPGDLILWAMASKRDWKKEQWKARYSQFRYLRSQDGMQTECI
jgi:hypothetical protein